MNDFKPITEWTLAELIEAAHERGTGFDPIFDEMLRRLEEAAHARRERRKEEKAKSDGMRLLLADVRSGGLRPNS